MDEPILAAQNLVAGYGGRRIVRGVDIELFPGEAIAVVGHNGAGKSTLLKTLVGLVPASEGVVRYEGTVLRGKWSASARCRGLVLVPQGQRIFPSLSVRENLELAQATISKIEAFGSRGVGRVMPAGILERFFPQLLSRSDLRAGALSGGEKQALAVAMGIVSSPGVLLLDEPSLGLGQGPSNRLFGVISGIREERGLSLIIVEHRIRKVLEIADRVYVMKYGEVVFSGSAAELQEISNIGQLILE